MYFFSTIARDVGLLLPPSNLTVANLPIANGDKAIGEG